MNALSKYRLIDSTRESSRICIFCVWLSKYAIFFFFNLFNILTIKLNKKRYNQNSLSIFIEMQKIRIKICCISSIEEAKLAVAYGASALGLVGHMPSGPGVISDQQISEITKSVPPLVSTFLLTSETKATAIIDHYKSVNTSTIQIVDALENRDYEQIKNKLPHVKIVQVIHVVDDKSVAEAIDVSAYVDAILLDSGNPNLSTKELGGTGRTHNWDLSRKIRYQLDIPVILAGGINSNNVKEAIEHVQPFGVDLCSSVRTNGKLDENKLSAFFQAVQSIHQKKSSI